MSLQQTFLLGLTSLFILSLAACKESGNAAPNNPAPPPSPALVVTLTASANPVKIGASVNLSWTSVNAATCVTSGAWKVPGSVPTSGNEASPALNADSTFSITCTGAGSTSVTKSVTVVVGTSTGSVIEIFPTDANTSCNEEFENKANALLPGDELVLHGGIFTQSCRRAITVVGQPGKPIIIRAATGEKPILTRPGNANYNYPQNNIEIENSSYLVIRGLTFQGGDIGVRFTGTSHDITFEDNEVFETGNNAVSVNSGNSDAMILRRNHIHHTGLYDLGTTEGEGMYLGCNNNTCRITNSLIEKNYIHHTRGTSAGGNDGIEMKVGSGGNTIRDNVIHDTNIGSAFPCIFVYGGGTSPNIVEGNALWNCGEAIQVVADAVIRNNLILNSSITGITAAPHAQVAQVKNVSIINNTIYGHPECLYINWSNASNMVLANNALYCPGKTAINAQGLTGATVKNNYLEGSGATIDNNGFYAGGTSADAFNNPATLDFWPKTNSILRGKSNTAYVPVLDFNGATRGVMSDVGAYDSLGAANNPGWPVSPGFKLFP